MYSPRTSNGVWLRGTWPSSTLTLLSIVKRMKIDLMFSQIHTTKQIKNSQDSDFLDCPFKLLILKKVPFSWRRGKYGSAGLFSVAQSKVWRNCGKLHRRWAKSHRRSQSTNWLLTGRVILTCSLIIKLRCYSVVTQNKTTQLSLFGVYFFNLQFYSSVQA